MRTENNGWYFLDTGPERPSRSGEESVRPFSASGLREPRGEDQHYVGEAANARRGV